MSRGLLDSAQVAGEGTPGVWKAAATAWAIWRLLSPAWVATRISQTPTGEISAIATCPPAAPPGAVGKRVWVTAIWLAR